MKTESKIHDGLPFTSCEPADETETLQAESLANLLWDCLKRDPEHADRRQTTWGTKTKLGLLRSVKAAIKL